MARTDEAELAIRLEARVRDFERNMQRAERAANKSFKKIEGDANDTASKLESSFAQMGANMGNSLKAGLVGALSVGALTAIVGNLKAITSEVANVGNAAKRAGVDTKTFQELAYVAKVNRIEVDALTDGLKEMSLRADELVRTGAGPAQEAFERLGFTAASLKVKLQDPSALFDEIITKLERLDRAAQIRVADEIFGGTGGERFVELLGQGEGALKRLRQEAHEVGAVLDDEMIKKADEIDRQFNKIATTVGTALKGAVIDSVSALDQFFDRFNKLEEQADNTIKARLGEIFTQRQSMIEAVAKLEADKANSSGFELFGPDYDTQIADTKAEIARLAEEAARLKDVLDRRNGYDENFIFKTGDEAKDASPKVATLGKDVAGLNAAGKTGAAGINSFADAIRTLKGEIPGLSEQLANLDARTRIEGAYQAALQNARSIGDTLVAEKLRDEALAALGGKGAREAAGGGMLDLIGYAEGTDKGRGYNETLAYGKFSGGNRNLVTMTLDEVDAMQSEMLRHPENGFNSSASGRYQIVQKTLRGLRKSLGLSGSELYDPAMQDRLATELLRQRGNDPAGLKNEWEGLRGVDNDTIRKAYDGQSLTMGRVDPVVADQRKQAADERAKASEKERREADANAKAQVEGYARIVEGARAFSAEADVEREAMGLNALAAAKLRHEHQLLAEAQRAGLTLSPQQRTELGTLAQKMAEAEVATVNFGEAQGRAQEMAEAWRGIASGAVQGLVSDLMAGKDAGEAFAGVLGRIADQLIQMAVDELFANAFSGAGAGAGGGAGGGGWMSGIVSAIGSMFGFAEGGYTGNGKKHEPAGIVHRGEVVWSKRDVARAGGVGAVEAMRKGLRGYADGGLVGRAPIAAPRFSNSASKGASNAAPAITVTSNVTVNAGNGTKEDSEATAKATARAVDAQIRAIFAQEWRQRQRPGGSF